jgi:DNA helicase HerA-like ATPase
VLGQLGNRVQHALRAFTPRDQKAVRAAAETFRQRKGFDTATAITELKVGEALVSSLDLKGAPTEVARTFIAPPAARVGPITEAERRQIMQSSPMRGRYEETVDSNSAFEQLQQRTQEAQQPAAPAGDGGIMDQLGGMLGGMLGGGKPPPINPKTGKPMRVPPTLTEQIIKQASTSAARSIGTQVSRAILRGVLGGIFGGKR